MKLLASVPFMLWIALPAAILSQSLADLAALQEATQAQNLKITAANFPTGEYQVNLTPPTGAPLSLNATRVDATTVTVPLSMVPPNTYTLSIVSGGHTSTVGPLTVYAPDDPQISRQPSLPEITRGQQVVIQGKNFVPGDYSVYLSANAGNPQDGIQLPATVSGDKLTFTVLSDKVPIARYIVWVKLGGKFYQVPGDLRLLADAQAPGVCRGQDQRKV